MTKHGTWARLTLFPAVAFLLSRRSLRRVSTQALVVITSGLLSLPFAWWPLLLAGGGDWREIFVWHLRHFFVLYGAFGVLFGLWYAVVRMPRPTPLERAVRDAGGSEDRRALPRLNHQAWGCV